MNTKESSNETICGFYASEFHLEMMILPYINKNIEENKKIYLINEKNLNESVKNVISKINLDESRKQNILNLGWDDKNDKKIKQINQENEKTTIIINGSDNFNKKINSQIEFKENFEIINCYNLEETNDIEIIKNNYRKIINSSGIKEFV